MKPRTYWLFLLLLALTLAIDVRPLRAQADPPAPTPLPTEPPVQIIITPTPLPTAAPAGNLLQQFWAQNQAAIILAFVMALVTGILVGVFLKQISSAIAAVFARLGHFLFDRFASAPLIRLRYEKRYRTTLADALQTLASSSFACATWRRWASSRTCCPRCWPTPISPTPSASSSAA